jgi:hypothetical protein
MVGVKLQWTIEDSFELKTKNIYKIKTALHIFKCHNRWCTQCKPWPLCTHRW